jgi:hypothetical protein
MLTSFVSRVAVALTALTRPQVTILPPLEVWCRRDRGGKHKTKVRRRERDKKTDNDRPSQPYYKKEQLNLVFKSHL